MLRGDYLVHLTENRGVSNHRHPIYYWGVGGVSARTFRSGPGHPIAAPVVWQGRQRRLSAWRSIASSSGSAPISRTSCAQRQATAIFAAHRSASSREGTSTSVNPPMASGYGPSVTAPSVATMLAGWFSSPPADTYTPALMASWTAARAALATAGASSSGMWSIAWEPNEIRYCVIHASVVPAACSGRVLTRRRTTRPDPIALPEAISHGSRPPGPASERCAARGERPR